MAKGNTSETAAASETPVESPAPVTQRAFDSLEDLVVLDPPGDNDHVYELQVAGQTKYVRADTPKQAAEIICQPKRVDRDRVLKAALAQLNKRPASPPAAVP